MLWRLFLSLRLLNLGFGLLLVGALTIVLAVSLFRVLIFRGIRSIYGVLVFNTLFLLLSRQVLLLAFLLRQDAVQKILPEIEVIWIKHNAHEPAHRLA